MLNFKATSFKLKLHLIYNEILQKKRQLPHNITSLSPKPPTKNINSEISSPKTNDELMKFHFYLLYPSLHALNFNEIRI